MSKLIIRKKNGEVVKKETTENTLVLKDINNPQEIEKQSLGQSKSTYKKLRKRVEMFKCLGSSCFFCLNTSLTDCLSVVKEENKPPFVVCQSCANQRQMVVSFENEKDPVIINTKKFQNMFSIEEVDVGKKIELLKKRCYCCGNIPKQLEPFLINQKEVNLNNFKFQLLCPNCSLNSSVQNYDFEMNTSKKVLKRNEIVNRLERQQENKKTKLDCIHSNQITQLVSVISKKKGKHRVLGWSFCKDCGSLSGPIKKNKCSNTDVIPLKQFVASIHKQYPGVLDPYIKKPKTKQRKVNTLEKTLTFASQVINNIDLDIQNLLVYRQSEKKLRKNTPDYIKRYEVTLQKRIIKSEEWFMSLWKQFSMDREYRDRNKDVYNYGVGPYIPDVVNFKYSYVIEIDGSIHDLEEIKEKDRVKQDYYENKKFKVFRVKHNDLEGFHLVRLEILKIKLNHAIQSKEIRNLQFLLANFFNAKGLLRNTNTKYYLGNN